MTTSWTPERLLSFFGDLPVSDWFNRRQLCVKSGEIDRQRIEANTAVGFAGGGATVDPSPVAGDRRRSARRI